MSDFETGRWTATSAGKVAHLLAPGHKEALCGRTIDGHQAPDDARTCKACEQVSRHERGWCAVCYRFFRLRPADGSLPTHGHFSGLPSCPGSGDQPAQGPRPEGAQEKYFRERYDEAFPQCRNCRGRGFVESGACRECGQPRIIDCPVCNPYDPLISEEAAVPIATLDPEILERLLRIDQAGVKVYVIPPR